MWLTTALCLWVVLLSAAWRLWLGGTPRDWPFKKGLTAFKYVVGMGLAGGIVWHLTADWRAAALTAPGYIAVWRIYKHGPMLQIPLGPNTKDLILKLVDWLVPPPEDRDLEWKRMIGANVRWWLYGHVRYAAICTLIGTGFALLGYRWSPMMLAGYGILASYWLSWNRRLKWDYDLMRKIADISATPDYRDTVQPYSYGHLGAGAALMAGIVGCVFTVG